MRLCLTKRKLGDGHVALLKQALERIRREQILGQLKKRRKDLELPWKRWGLKIPGDCGGVVRSSNNQLWVVLDLPTACLATVHSYNGTEKRDL